MNKSSLKTSQVLAVLRKTVAVLFLLFVFLVAINGLGSGFKLLGKDFLGSFFAATENPFVGLIVGIFATTLVQSSSVSTSMIVAMVAAPANPLPLANAVPMVMGANIGTTVTNTVVSLGHMGRPAEFRRAFAVATCHDFFNLISVAVLLPLEIFTGYLSTSAQAMAGLFSGGSGITYHSPIKGALKTAGTPLKWAATALSSDTPAQAAVLILLSALLVFFSLLLLVKVLRSVMHSRVEAYVSRALEANALVMMTVGMIVTVMVQSSSITTSLLVPLAGAGIVTLRTAFPITLGANLGTTITALLASMAVSGPNAMAGVAIALVHLLFNLTGILMVYPIASIRQVPLVAAQKMADLAVKSRKLAVLYVVGLFYGIPGLLVLLEQYF